MSSGDALASPSLARRVAGQGAMLFSGFAASQIMSFLRNAILGHTLAKGDFGIAATLTLLLQLLDSLSDLGVDRLIVQDPDGDRPRFVASQHLALVVRGLLIGAILFLASGSIAGFFSIPEAAWAFAAMAVVPVIKGFQHLDARRAQRTLNNRPFMLVEVIPQAAALLLTLPMLSAAPGFAAVVWLSIIQAAATLAVSHAVAERPYAIGYDQAVIEKLLRFGWPIWLSAFPLVAVFHGDRIVIGHMIGMEELAGYSAAFMIAMVPGLIAAKVGHALMLPIFAGARDDPKQLVRRFAAMSEATAIVASVYLATAILLGGFILEIAFGPNYRGLGGVTAWLGIMWSMRMLQAVPGMVLMAAGETRPFLVAGLIRATALIPATYAAAQGYGLEAIAAAGVAGELASLIYVTRRLDRTNPGMSWVFAGRAVFLAPAALAAGLTLALTTVDGAPLDRAAALLLTVSLIAAAGVSSFPETRHRIKISSDETGELTVTAEAPD